MYKVIVDDNFHHGETGYLHGTFENLDDALAACREITEDSVQQYFKPGETAEEMHSNYRMFGDDPYVVAPVGAERVTFCAWDFARERFGQLATVPSTLEEWENLAKQKAKVKDLLTSIGLEKYADPDPVKH